MVLPVPAEGARGLLSFRLFGIPVSIHGSFLVVAFALGAVGQGYDAALVWAAVVTVSVLAHEMGHALVAPRRSQPRIDLFALAGLTRWNAAGAGRGRTIAVSLAGVGGGILLGLGVLAVYYAVDPDPESLVGYAFQAALFANLGWGILNLLPMLPLDGGHVMRALMPARDERTRDTRTAAASLVVGGLVALAAVLAEEYVAAAFVAFLAVGNLQVLTSGRRVSGDVGRLQGAEEALVSDEAEKALRIARGVENHPAATVIAAAALLRLDRPREAQHLLLDLPEGIVLDQAFEAAVLLANGQERLARERLAASLSGNPAPWAVGELAVLLHRRGEDVEAALADVRGEALVPAVTTLFRVGAFAESARLAERALGSGVDDPIVAYNAACGWARAGDVDRALRFLDHAVLLGLRNTAMLDRDPDLAEVREHAGWAAVRSRAG